MVQSTGSTSDVVGYLKSNLPSLDRAELDRLFSVEMNRFLEGTLEPMSPVGSDVDRSTNDGAVARARRRARESGAFHLGQQFAFSESSRSDAELEGRQGELIELTVRLQMMAEPLPGAEVDAAKLHRELDDLESKTEQAIVEIERCLKRRRDGGDSSQ